MSAGTLTQRDFYRFISTYRRSSLRETLKNDQLFWARVASRAQSLQLAEQRRNLHGSPATARTLPNTRIQY